MTTCSRPIPLVPAKRGCSHWRGIGARLAVAGVLSLFAGSVWGDEQATAAVTEFENVPRRLISLVHEPYAAAVSADGVHLATGHDDGSIVLWDVDTGRPVRNFVGHRDTVCALAFDASGTRLASGSYDATARAWDVATGDQTSVFHGHESRLTTVAFSPDGNSLVSGAYDETARIWSFRQPEAEPIVLPQHEATVRAASFSPSGEHVATGDDTGTLRVWNTAHPNEPASVDAHNGALRSLRFSPDGSILITGGDDGAVTRWETDGLQRVEATEESFSPMQHAAPVTRVAISADGRLLAMGDQQGEVQIWDLATGEPTSPLLDGHEDEIIGLAFLPQAASLLTVGRDRSVNVWRSKRPFSPRLASLDNGDVRLWSLAVAPNDAAIYTGGRPGYLAAWDLQTGQRTRQFEGFEGTIDENAITSEGTHIACCGWKEEHIVVFDTATGEKAVEFKTETNMRCVEFSPDDNWLAAGGEDGTLRLWEWRTDADATLIPTGPLPVYDVAFSPDSRQLVTCSGDWRTKEPGHVTFWKRGDAAGSWSEVRKLSEHTQAVRAVTFNRDGSRMASAGEDGMVIVWDAETRLPVARLRNATGVRPVAFSPWGDRLAVGLHDGTINVWDIDRNEIVQRFQSEDDVFALSYSRDGSVLFSVSGERSMEMWPAAETTSTAERIRGWSP